MDDNKILELLTTIAAGQEYIKKSIGALETDLKEIKEEVSTQRQETNYMQAEIRALVQRVDEHKSDTKTNIDDVYEYVNAEKERTEKKFEEMKEYAHRLTSERDKSCAMQHESMIGSLKVWILGSVVAAAASILGTLVMVILKFSGLL